MKVGLVILDGWGLNPDEQARDAVAAAETPTVDRLGERAASGTLETSGRRVGLPEGQMGNSEVGHLNIGAGRVLVQESARITDAIDRWRGEETAFDEPADPPLDDNDAIAGALDHVEQSGGRLHLLGLVSDGGVHSYQSHLHALIELAADRGVEAVTHAFTDGRDTAPKSGKGYLETLEAHAAEQGTGHVATVSGRYYAMDRDENWERTKRAYDAIVSREAEYSAASAPAAATESYDRETTDEFIEPTLIDGGPALSDGDAAVFVNFRSDRARQLTRMLADIDPEWPFETTPPEIELVTMTQYDETFDLPVAFPPTRPENTLGAVLAEHGLTQLRIAETEKYPHVTYFLNGGREVEFDGELREIVPSPDVATYDQQPEMSAEAVTDQAVSYIETEDPDVVVLNYANPDMVGHTGDFEAAVAAVEAVDANLSRLLDAVSEAGAHALVTADHGNADEMGTAEEPHTAHTTNPVPVFYRAPDGTDGGEQIRGDGTLADLAPTILRLLGVEKPAEMTGETLLE
ncbi:2,3-bisphosphoglycerate-independent phosphoglycerate mutase [Halovenus sp. WSH3]|uniref:2,3-bisphosphoglycerate-independent phosphoglycerate mutase n=1 Tax=Halovenus carboxidivorans TaxID=2692199 RepID=A0A6B0T961_9EURY|nr:2,3-bisphosphoglycerate-independent phosphoglycerate mutase [Halovenus carboxidivorans]MXR51781.1 2,3-bisphosphoglycerate-independent phosphoglycerate mutase [Halovenus carboxidivorans]